MKVYHGSTQAVEYPLVGVGRENLDFGKGFYVTDIYAQAERWGAVMALRHPGSTSVVNIYELDVEKINSSGYKWLHFDGYNNDWLEFIVSSRLGKQPWLEYDIVEGEVYNVGGHNEKTNLEIVKLTIATVRRLMEEEPRYRAVLKKQVKAADGTIDISWINEDLITFVKDRLGHDQRYAIDPTKITNALGWYPETKFEVGIVKTIEWYLNNQPWVEEVTSGDYQKYYEQMYGGRG